MHSLDFSLSHPYYWHASNLSRLGKSKSQSSQPFVKLKYIERMEHCIAKRRERINFHEEKWEIIRKYVLTTCS